MLHASHTKQIRTCVLAFALLTLSAIPALAGPPLITDDAGTVDVGKVEAELNGSYVHDRETVRNGTLSRNATDAEAKISTGIARDLGISLTVPYSFNNRQELNGELNGTAEGFGDMTLELKYVFLELDGTRFAIKPSLIIPSGRYGAGLSEGRWQLGSTLIATREFDEGKYALHANLGYEHHDYRTDEARAGSRSDLWSASVAGEAKLLPRLTAVADLGVARAVDATTTEPAAYALVGVRYELSSLIDLDAGVKFGLTRPEDDVTALYGIVLKF